MRINKIILSAACCLGVAMTPAFAQYGNNGGTARYANTAGNNNGGNNGNAFENNTGNRNSGHGNNRNGNNANNGNSDGGNGNYVNGAESGAGLAGNAMTARVPQYWIADADIFAGSAAHTASIMTQEGRANVESPAILENQAQFMVNCINRATRDLAGIDANAVKTNPNAVPAVRDAQAQLQAAIGDTYQLRQALRAGGLGPTFHVTLDSAASHLNAAVQGLGKVAKAYPGSGAIQSSNFTGANAGAQGANGAGVAGAAAAQGIGNTGAAGSNGSGPGTAGGR